MTVISTPATGIIRTQTDQSAKLSAALNNRLSIESAIPAGAKLSGNNAVDTIDSVLESQAISLRADSLYAANVTTKLDIFDSGAVQVSRILGQLQSLATRAASAGGLSESALRVLNGQFQALRISINNVPPSKPPGAEFKVEDVLGNLASDDIKESYGNQLLGGFATSKLKLDDADISTPEAAKQTLTQIEAAIQVINAQLDTIAGLQQLTDFAAASLESAVQNQEASQSVLREEDLVKQDTQTVALQASLVAQAEVAKAAQTNRLPSNILQLLG